jgi:hypothetical protein
LDDENSASLLLISVRLPLIALFDVSMPRDVAEIVPSLVMTTPGEASPVVQVIAVPITESVLPSATKPVSLFETVFAVAGSSGGTLKFAAKAELNAIDDAATTNASLLAWFNNSTFTTSPLKLAVRGNLVWTCNSLITAR